MPARPWADTQRLAFLRENLPAYEAAQERKKTRIFLARFHDNYFARFPQPNEALLGLEKKVREPRCEAHYYLLTLSIARQCLDE